MKKILLTLSIAIISLFSACSDKPIFDEKHNFANTTWMRFDAEVFDVNIKNTNDCYDLYFSVTIDTNVLKLNNIPLVISIDDEEGGRRVFMSDIILRDKEGKSHGNALGNYVEFKTKVREYFYFNSKGLHKFSVKNGTHLYELKGIASIGLKIEKSNMDINIENF